MPKLDLTRAEAIKMAGGTVASLKGPGFSWSSAAVPDWAPGDETLAAWFDASVVGDFTLTGSGVDTWNDKSGNAYHLTRPGGTRPTRTLYDSTYHGVAFTGDQTERLEHDAGSDAIDVSPFTAFFVVRFNAAAQFDRIMEFRRSATGSGGIASPNLSFYRNSDTSGEYPLLARSDGTGSTEVTGSAGPLIFHARCNGSVVIAGVNGTEAASVSANNPADMRYMRMAALCSSSSNPPGVSVSGNLNGAVHEAVIVRGYIDPAHPVNSYFKPKWGIT